MDVELTRLGKHSLILDSPVMPAAGTFGFGDLYTRLIKTEKLGAIVTDPVSLRPRRAARGTHVIPLAGGLLMHTGLPNPGVNKVISEYRKTWARLPVPVIVHVMDRDPTDLRRCVRALLNVPNVQGFELGMHGATTREELITLIDTVVQTSQLPLLVRVPLERALELAPVIANSEAGAIVVGAPPRGTALDPIGGEPISGRVFGPLVKPQALHAVSTVIELVKHDDLPVIGAGGIHSPLDAREFIAMGARAVQLDSVIWTRPVQAEVIARDLGGLQLTRESDAYADEWFPGIGDTYRKQALPPPPSDLPE
jgi:dihydroorotate dehydrogenase (NAD+) catalytic subunit